MGFLKIFVGGDVVNYHQKDGEVVDAGLEELIQNVDYAVCNFEAPIHGFGKAASKIGPHHSQRPETINGLKKQGFDLLLLANNHIMDFGYDGLKATIDRANTVGMDAIGAGPDFESAYKPLIKEIGGLKIGMLNACEAQFGVIDYFREADEPGYAWINHCSIDESVSNLKRKCDYVIVFAHAGLENYSLPQKEWRVRYKTLCDAGADFIIGSHPHVPQGYERYKESVIFYSLGNFYFDSKNYIDKSDSSYSVILKLPLGSGGADFDLVYHHKEGDKTKLAFGTDSVDVQRLNGLLGVELYMDAHNEMSIETYYKNQEKLRLSVSKGYCYGSFLKTIKGILRRFLLGRKGVDKDMLQLHLLRNEAYYFATRHALELKCREKSKGE